MSENPHLRTIFRHHHLSKSSLLIAAFAIICLAASAWALLTPGGKTVPAVSAAKADSSIPTSALNNSAQERVEAEIITIRPKGFEPAEITRPKGRFILAVDNRSGLKELQLNLEREKGNREREARVRENKHKWRDIVDLSPGQYVLTEANHPDWACRINITEK